MARSASSPFVPAARGEIGDPGHEACDAACIALGLRAQMPDAPIVVLACHLDDLTGVASVARSAVALCLPVTTYVIGVVEVPTAGDPEVGDELRDLHAACHAVVVTRAGDGDPLAGGDAAATKALIGLCTHRGWVAIHPFDVVLALGRCGYFRVGTAGGERADIAVLAELAATRATVGARPGDLVENLLIHLEVSNEAGAMSDLFLVVETVSAHVSHEGEAVWAYTVRAGEGCRITVLAAQQTTPEDGP